MANKLARQLRRNVTEAEKTLWQQLRLLKDEHRHFRRQVPIGTYIVDFACHYCKLVVELDGGQHNEPQKFFNDQKRTGELQKFGYRVIRFWNVDVFENLEGVVDMIRNAARLPTTNDYREAKAGATPAPNPSPQGGGE
jgi:very-short-patch-repair endonuclease